MSLTTSQAMAQFLADITVTEYQKTSMIKGRKERVIQNLSSVFPATSDMPFGAAHLMGSAAKSTIVRPIADVDVLAVFSNVNGAWSKYRLDSQAFLYRIRRAYDGLSIAQVGARGQAVRVFFETGGHVDVAPVFHHGNEVYALPNGTGGWINTAPTVGITWFGTRNRDLGYNLAPTVRLLKKWNGAHSKRMRSFHLETVAGAMFSKLGVDRQEALEKFFEWAPTRLDVNDPGGQSGSLSGYLTWSQRTDLVQALNSARERAVKARAAAVRGDHEEAKRLWRLVLGHTFPG